MILRKWRKQQVASVFVAGVSGMALALASFVAVEEGKAGEAAPTNDAGTIIRRLSEDQYIRVIEDTFGSGIKISGRFEPLPRQEGLLAVGAGRVGLTASGIEQYDSIARSIAAQAVDQKHRDVLVPCKPQSARAPDEACASQFLAKVGQLLFRRPLSSKELKMQVADANKVADSLHDFYAGIELSLASMLVAPEFLFRQETVEADPANPGQYRLDGYSKAARLSFFFWNAAPDARLLAAAENGTLHTSQGLAKEIDRLSSSSRLVAGVRAFFTDMLAFDTFSALAKDAALYPKFTTAVADQAQEQTLQTIVNLLINEKGDYRDLFTTRKTVLTPLLGTVYGLPVLRDRPLAYPETWVPVEYPAGDPRTGILTHVSFVALHSHPGRTSPTLRGKALREQILCQRVPDPPGNVNFAVVQDTNNPLYKTARERLNAHATEGMCTGCHKIMDPVGLALENFDSAGGFRTQENGAVLDTSGAIDGVSYKDAPGLGQAVHDSQATTQCLVRRLSSFAMGRAPKSDEAEWLKSLGAGFAKDGFRVPDLMKRIASSSEFFHVSAPSGGL